MSQVFVVDSAKRPLDPVHSGRARTLLTAGKAAVFRRYPFTIILKQALPTASPHPLRVKVDPGNKTTGLAVVNDQTGEVVWAADLTHRAQRIRDALLSRRAIRRSRRHRHTRLPRLLFVGGDFQRKGGTYLLKCFERFFADRAELHLVTQTPIQPSRNVVVHAGLTPNSEPLRQLYAVADLFVFPTLADCAPLAVPEAVAASLPVIATRVGAIPKMVTDGEHGLLVVPGDMEGLRAAIERLLTDAELRARMGAAGRRRVEADYDAACNAVRLLDVLRATVRRSGRSAAPMTTPDGWLQQIGGGR